MWCGHAKGSKKGSQQNNYTRRRKDKASPKKGVAEIRRRLDKVPPRYDVAQQATGNVTPRYPWVGKTMEGVTPWRLRAHQAQKQ